MIINVLRYNEFKTWISTLMQFITSADYEIYDCIAHAARVVQMNLNQLWYLWTGSDRVPHPQGEREKFSDGVTVPPVRPSRGPHRTLALLHPGMHSPTILLKKKTKKNTPLFIISSMTYRIQMTIWRPWAPYINTGLYRLTGCRRCWLTETSCQDVMVWWSHTSRYAPDWTIKTFMKRLCT